MFKKIVQIATIAAGLVASWFGASEAAEKSRRQVPYVPTPDKVIERMLDLSQVGSGDYVMDLGAGDGRIVIQAIQRGAYGHGVELKRSLVQRARTNAEQAGVADRGIFREQDLTQTDFSQASVVTMYLAPDVNSQVRERLLAQLRPGARIVSHGFGMGLWEADETIEVELEQQPARTVHLWIVPADVAGRWRWWLGDRCFDWRVEQQYRQLDTRLQADGCPVTPEAVALRGNQIALATVHDRVRYAFSGRVEDGRIDGTVQVDAGGQRRLLAWHARRQ